METRRRHGLPPRPTWFRNLLACFGDRLTLWLASRDSRLLAGIVTLRHNRTLIYKYAASDAAFHLLPGMLLLLRNVIRTDKSEGCVALDLGRCDLDDGGLIRFKENSGAKRSPLRYFRYSALSAFRMHCISEVH